MTADDKPIISKSDCAGCTNDFYNGHNPHGIAECWHFKTARPVNRLRIGVWQNPPYDRDATIVVPNCRTEKGSVLVNVDALDEKGFWRS